MRPRVKPHIAFVPVGEEDILVRGPGTFLRYSGEAVPLLRAIIPLLDGTHAVDALAEASGHDRGDIKDVLEALAADKLIDDAAADEALAIPSDPGQLAVWSHLTRMPNRAQNRICAARVLVLGEGMLADAIAAQLHAAGVEHVARGGAPDRYTHVVVAADAPAPDLFAQQNDACLAAGVPVTFAHLDGADATIGPTVIPGESACWRCYDLRVLGAHPSIERTLRYRKLAPPPAAFALPSFAPIVGAWTAQATLVAVSGAGLPPQAGHVTRVALLDLEARRHRVLRMPRCPSCAPDGGIPDIDRYALEPLEP